ncbi:MAG: hypothetical protein QOH63_1077 [Acidobacteriota bacterium]|jgi:hypothetical protein|nr:hypothetical protein [Acidobacteriota bacterium]
MKRTILLIVTGCLATVLMLGCSSHGTKLEYGKGELYYTKNVTEAEAKKLGDYLTKIKFFEGDKKSVQLDKSGDTYQFRMVVKEGLDKDEKYLTAIPTAALELSKNVFDGAKVEIHLCDDQLKTLKVVPMNG